MDTPIMGVYAIHNQVNGKLYVGASTNIHVRWAHHRATLAFGQHANPRLQADWRKHGGERFRPLLFELVPDRDDLLSRERFWIRQAFQVYGPGCYNTYGRTPPEHANDLTLNLLELAIPLPTLPPKRVTLSHLKEAREQLALSVEALAVSAEVHIDTIRRIEAGGRTPARIAEHLMKILGIAG